MFNTANVRLWLGKINHVSLSLYAISIKELRGVKKCILNQLLFTETILVTEEIIFVNSVCINFLKNVLGFS